MKSYKELLEAKRNTVVMGFGRLNPVTQGHELMANAIVNLAKQKNADHVLFLSRSQDAKKNPLNVDQKVYYARQSFKGMNILGATDQIRTFIEAAKSLTGKYDNLIMVAGSDRVLEYKQLLDKYNGKDFNFKSILVVSAGERDPDADGASGMSATKMRAAATANDFKMFLKGVPSGMNSVTAKKMFDDVRAGMKLNESSDVREDYINEKIFNIGDIVVYEDMQYPVTFRGSNYVILDNNVKAWLHEITTTDMIDESIMVKHQDKLKAAKIIGMSLGYEDAESKSDPVQIVNTALRGIRNKPMNSEMKKILARMLELAKKMDIGYDEKILNLSEDTDRADYKITKSGRKYHKVIRDKESEEVNELASDTLKSYTKKAMQDTLSGNKDRNKGMVKAYSKLAGTDKPLMKSEAVVEPANTDDEEKEAHNLMTKPGIAQQSNYERLRKIHIKAHESVEDSEEDDEFDEDEMDELVNSISDEDIIEHGYDDDEFHLVDDESGEVMESFEVDMEELNEVLSRIERMRAKVKMKKSEAKRERAMKIALKRKSSGAVIAKRARRIAVKTLEKRLAKKPLNTLSVAEKERIEQRISRMGPAITKLATRMVSRVRNTERTRLQHSSTKE